MVIIRGLGRVLGVIGRALEREREHNHHSDDIPQRRRPTASARRQREAAVAEDAPHVDDATEDVFQHAEEVVDDVEARWAA